ncbi:MAG: class I SAM-dependent methyltransferase [Nitrospirae bacterium]|nr:class I SAM-dependent methyltransferase [Nitrospirota bacterium]
MSGRLIEGYGGILGKIEREEMHFTGERLVIGEDIVLEKEHLDRYNFVTQFVKGKKVLDIACGTGYGCSLLQSADSLYILGIDISHEAIRHAKSNYKAQNLDFIMSSADTIGVLSKVFDIVISFETIEHLERYMDFLKEIKRVLNDGGMFVVSTPNKKYSTPDNPYHLHEFFYDEFYKLLTNLFKNVVIYGQDHQNPQKRITRSLTAAVPKSIRKLLIPKSVRDEFNLKQYTGITTTDVENCRYLIAVCTNIPA